MPVYGSILYGGGVYTTPPVATPATGRTLGKFARVYVDGYLAGDSWAYQIGTAFPEKDVTTVTSGIHWGAPGMPSTLAGLKLWFNNAAGSGAYTLLKNQAARVLCIAQGIKALPAVGDPCFASVMSQMDFQTDAALGTAVAISVELSGRAPGSTSIGWPWGTLLHADGQETATQTGPTIDLLSVSGRGAQGFLMVTAAGGVWSIRIEHASDSGMSLPFTLMTFTANGSGVAAETQTVTGTVYRYVRVVATRTSGNLNYLAAIVRG